MRRLGEGREGKKVASTETIPNANDFTQKTSFPRLFSPRKQKPFNTHTLSGVQFFENQELPPTSSIIDPQ